jgi:nucleoside-diphosphate-sugar epimerase
VTPERLDELLSRPTPAAVDALRRCPGDVVVLGAGGKMGPTLARLVRRCVDEQDAGARRVVAVSRWSDAAAERALQAWGVETVRADLTDRAAMADLPDAPNVVFMAGQKFGTAGRPEATWAMNVLVPDHCAERYLASRIVAFSTGNVYPLTPVASGGSREDDALAPVGEYAASCVGRERVLAWHAARHGTRIAIVRLNYAIALRYGVLTDLALRVWRGEPVALAMGHVNVVWQGDANALAVAALAHAASPPFVVNLTGGEALSVRTLATALGERLGRAPVFDGEEAPDALLSDTTRMRETLGPAETTLDEMLDWTAAWVQGGGELLGKPTKFERRDGAF